MTNEKAIDKIQKLLAKANDAGTTQAEAASFAAKAAEIAAREKLELSDIDWENRKQGRPIGTYRFDPREHELKPSKSRVAWMENLVAAIARSQDCRLVLMGGNTYDIIGRKGNVEIAVYLAAFLTKFALDMSWRDYGVCYRKAQADGDVTRARGFRASWLNSFTAQVHRRLSEMRRTIELEYAQSTAMVRMTSEIDEVSDWMRQNMNLGKANALAGRKGGNAAGSRKGQAAGNHVDVTGRAAGAGTDAKRLS